MNEQNKNQNHGETPKPFKGAPVDEPSAWKKLLSKRWVYPAAYMAAAAIILTLVWVYQDASQKSLTKDLTTVSEGAVSQVSGVVGMDKGDPEALEVLAKAESMTWPVANAKEVNVVKPFYDPSGTKENHQEAMVQYNDISVTNNGIDLAREDNKSFEVKAALSGKVTRVELHPLMGTVVEVTHSGNLKTVYQSVTDAKVKVGDEVIQGNVLASAGRSEMESDLGNHVHFEVYNSGNLVNPAEVLPPK
ncbi:peptidoglycan DD-metalloendopeptidase family protein [Paenibacillus sp. FA6]|uniref:peptidoglycan DD-metalloendopeptidase family protein n=1 Tax=Paenibacillus sp. FA6 TaxID=3413029 RepID=UPI003F654CBF